MPIRDYRDIFVLLFGPRLTPDQITHRMLRAVYAQGEAIMSAISDFATKVSAHNARIDKAIEGLAGDVKYLTDLIETLQTTPGPISAEDQATLDAIEIAADGLATKLEGLDAITPPPPPTE